tara:strand:- start:68 stop:418 length:351 start_codon:yes stop_codon:yes gene_type:complete
MNVSRQIAAAVAAAKPISERNIIVGEHYITLGEHRNAENQDTFYMVSIRLGFKANCEFHETVLHLGQGDTPYEASLYLSSILEAVAKTIRVLDSANPLGQTYAELSRALCSYELFS